MLSVEATTVRTSTRRVGDGLRGRPRTGTAIVRSFGVVGTVLAVTLLTAGCGTATDTAAPAGATGSLTAAGPGAPTSGANIAVPGSDRTTTGRTNTAHRSATSAPVSKPAKAAGSAAPVAGPPGTTGATGAGAGADPGVAGTGAPDGGVPGAGGGAGAAGGSTSGTQSRKAVARTTVGGTGSRADTEAAGAVVGLVNAARKAAGCPALVPNKVLAAVALDHSRDMATARYFEHASPDGRTPFDRMKKAGYAYGNAAENIAAGQQTAAEVMDSWMHSTGHRANILDCALTQIGVGVYRDPASPFRIYWTQDFGTPA